MIPGLSLVSAILTAVLVVVGAALTLIGSFGLLRLRSFYERIHAPTLGTTLGTVCVALASIVHLSTAGGRPVLHEVLIIAFVTLTTPISLMILTRAAVFRDRAEKDQAASGGTEIEDR